MASPAAIRPGFIIGRVVAAEGGYPVPGASIKLVGTALTGSSFGNGLFRLGGVPPGTPSLEVRAPGFHPAVVACGVGRERARAEQQRDPKRMRRGPHRQAPRTAGRAPVLSPKAASGSPRCWSSVSMRFAMGVCSGSAW